MFYFFSKTLNYLLTPAGWLLAVLLLAFFTKKPQRRRQLVGAALLVFWVFGNSFLMNELALFWEYAPAPVPARSPNSVAVVLTGGMMSVSKQVPDNRFLLDAEADRAGQALYLYKQGAVEKILISGGYGNLPFQFRTVSDEGQMTARFLLAAGVRPEDIILENKSRNTRENALFTARMLRERLHTNRCVLITSAWHLRRADACFQKAGVTVTPFPGSFMSTRRSFGPGEWLLPQEEAFADAYYLVKEIVGYAVYKVVGYC
ncbi:YdcF family protein [Spirosoma taeanense]|uniref:YdcF family protein n=1 Tax=Spirosoma taeanense TaxID=2735870 RepID=A0A6M5YCU1_9BACT|nr:YdcF family protein [Spirosoma taeanense]QJW91096.1 YdcF family protein [Spirosoma taeanense]